MFRNPRFILMFVALFITVGYSFAQTDDEIYDDEITDSLKVDKNKKRSKDKKKGEAKKMNVKGLFFGSALGFDIWSNNFGQNTLRFDISPHVGYRLGDIFYPAIGVTYTYFTELGQKNSTNVIGPKVMLRIRPIKNVQTLNRFYIHGEAEYLTLTQNVLGRRASDNQTRINAGLGYATNLENGFGFTTEVLFDFNYLRTGWTYFNPFTYRIGFYYGF